MLIGIDPLLRGSLLARLDEMGHGDMIVIADANFPARRLGRHVIDLPGARLEFYERAQESVLIVATGELRPYGNLILRKGVVTDGQDQ